MQLNTRKLLTSPLVSQPMASPKAVQPEANPEASRLEASPEAGKLGDSPRLDIGLVESAIGISSDEGISRGQISRLLVQRLEDVSLALSVSFVASCYKNVILTFVFILRRLSLLKMVEKALAEDEANALLRRRVAELEAANAQMLSELDHSGEALTALQSEFVEKDEMCKRLTCCNVVLRNEWNEARDITEALEQKLAKIEEYVAAAKECFEGYCAKIIHDMISLHETYECNVITIGGLCAPIGDGASSADSYLCWLKSTWGGGGGKKLG
jgi:hypothetical protein